MRVREVFNTMKEATTYCDHTPHTGFTIHRRQDGRFVAVVDVIEQEDKQIQMDLKARNE